jgi:hypothetical protein
VDPGEVGCRLQEGVPPFNKGMVEEEPSSGIFGPKGNGGPRKELAAAGRRMTRCTGIAPRKEHGLQKKGQDDLAPFGKRCWKYSECINGITGIRNQNSIQQVRLRNEKTTTIDIGAWTSGQHLLPGSGGVHMKAPYEMGSVNITKQNAESSSWMRSFKDWTLWRGRPLPNRLKR